jgi:hypothetical protein
LSGQRATNFDCETLESPGAKALTFCYAGRRKDHCRARQ